MADDAIILELTALADRTGISFSEVVRRALREFASRHAAESRLPSFVAAGASGGKLRLSERAEELLFERKRPD